MRERTLSSVLLPAPLRPIMPTTSPCLISKETSFNAHISSSLRRRLAARVAAAPCLVNGARAALASVSRSVWYGCCPPPSRYCLESPSTRMAMSLILFLAAPPSGSQGGAGVPFEQVREFLRQK